jgi:universal stress protein A
MHADKSFRRKKMARYKKILLALDFHQDNEEVVSRGIELAKDHGADVFLIHVNEPMAAAYGLDTAAWSAQIVDVEVAIRKEAQAKMAEIAKSLSVPVERCVIREGRPAHEIHEIAKENDIDCIVLGTHGQAGIQLLLGSTANGVLHGVSCDVLTVRVGKA